MPDYFYEALREPGPPVTGEVEADSDKAAVAALAAKGYHVLTIHEADKGQASRLRLGIGPFAPLKHRALVRTTRDSANLLKAGLPLAQVLETLSKRAANATWSSVSAGYSRQDRGRADLLSSIVGLLRDLQPHVRESRTFRGGKRKIGRSP
ncbi:MAG: hypothetical protein ACOX5J_01005 [Candidatus Hydrogenedentales bacterium]